MLRYSLSRFATDICLRFITSLQKAPFLDSKRVSVRHSNFGAQGGSIAVKEIVVVAIASTVGSMDRDSKVCIGKARNRREEDFYRMSVIPQFLS